MRACAAPIMGGGMPPRGRRLRRLATQLSPAAAPSIAAPLSAAAASPQLLAEDIERERQRIAKQNANRDKGLVQSDWESLGLPFPVLDVEDGAIPEAQLRELEAVRDSAASSRDFRSAALHQDLITTLGPAPTPQLSACLALQTADERAAFFLEHGFCVIKAFEGATLHRLQEAWMRASEPIKRSWEETVARDGARLVGGSRADLFFDIPDILEQDDAFLETVDQPDVSDVLQRVVGSGVRCWQSLARTLPATGDRAADDPLARSAYSTWHRDSTGAPDSWPLPEGRCVRICSTIRFVLKLADFSTLVLSVLSIG